MSDIIFSILTLLSGCGVFMIGMKFMGDGLERGAGGAIRKIFSKISNRRFAGVGLGAGVTAIIQSSSATTVMVIGFVNAGVMTLFQAAAIIMGANIGTTVTAILVSLPVADFAMALSLVGIFMIMFSKKDKIKNIGTILAGLGLIFVGLDFMSSAFKSDEGLSGAFEYLFTTISFPLFLIMFGMIFTAIIQSSSAATGLIVTLVGAEVLGVESALFIVLGTNIGTCITAILASIGASTNAKRAAIIHLSFNLIGTLIFTLILLIFKNPIVSVLALLSPLPEMQIAYFHVFFNVLTTLMLLPFINLLTGFAIKVIKEKQNDDEILKLYYIDDRILQTPAIAVAQVVKEVTNMAQLAQTNLDHAVTSMLEQDVTKKDKIYKTERKINYINKAVGRYLVKISSTQISDSDEQLIGSLFSVISDVERIGDHAKNFIEKTIEMKESEIAFSDEATAEITEMYACVKEMFDSSLEAFISRCDKHLPIVNDLEAKIDEYKKQLSENHIERLHEGACDVDSGVPFYATIAGLERVADHLNNIAYSFKKTSLSKMRRQAKKIETQNNT